MIFDVQGGLQNLSATDPIRRRLLSTALQRLEQLSGDYVKKSSVDRPTAIALSEMADLVLRFGEAPRAGNARGVGGPSAGESRAAPCRGVLSDLHTLGSMEILQALAKSDPYDAQARRDLSVSCIRLGDVHLQRGSTDEALRSFRKALA